MARISERGIISFQRLNNFLYFSFQLVLDSVKSIMSIPTKTTYVTSFPKRNDITGSPDQVFKFDNFLDYLICGIRAKTIAAIGTINPGSLCIQYGTSSPLRSITIYPVHPSLSLGTHPIRKANSVWLRSTLNQSCLCLYQRQGDMGSRSSSWRRHSYQ